MASGPIHRGCGPGLGFVHHCRGRNPPCPGLPDPHPGLPPAWGHTPAGPPHLLRSTSTDQLLREVRLCPK